MGVALAMVAGAALIFFALGFLVGTRAKQILAAFKASGQAIVSIKELLKAGAMNPSDNDENTEPVDDHEAEEEEPEEILEKFMNSEITEGLDNHSDLAHNPVLLYEVKKTKDLQRRERRKQQMIAEGMDEEDAERALLEAENMALEMGTSSGLGGRQNAMAMLISVGARFTSARVEGVEAAAAEERKEDALDRGAWLSKTKEIDTQKKERNKSSTRKNAKNAYEMALSTQKVPFGGDSMKLELERVEMAKVGRNLLRDTYGRARKLPHGTTIRRRRRSPEKEKARRPRWGRRKAHNTGRPALGSISESVASGVRSWCSGGRFTGGW